jgi:hypothetical protein
VFDVRDDNVGVKHGLGCGAFCLNRAYGKLCHLKHLHIDVTVSHANGVFRSDRFYKGPFLLSGFGDNGLNP